MTTIHHHLLALIVLFLDNLPVRYGLMDTTTANAKWLAQTNQLANGYPLDRVLRLANITGALSVEKLGSRYSMAELNDVLERDKREENA